MLARQPDSLPDALHPKTQPNDDGEVMRFAPKGCPSFPHDEDGIAPAARREQAPLDLIDEASMESFPCSDPPSYNHCHI